MTVTEAMLSLIRVMKALRDIGMSDSDVRQMVDTARYYAASDPKTIKQVLAALNVLTGMQHD